MTSITKTIPDPALGERALVVHPPISPGGDQADFQEQGWGRRTRYVAGRSVTERALQVDQRHTEGHVPTAAQRTAPGVVVGLDVTVEGDREAPVLHIAPGIGVVVNGEDVRILHPVEIPARALWVAGREEEDVPRRLSEVLDDDPGAELALIVQLRPVVVERTGDDDEDDPCEIDPEAIAFTDEQLVDGCRIRLYPVLLPPGLSASHWRNDVAYEVFQQEIDAGQVAPWSSGGVPIGLLGFPPGGGEPFVDIHAAARRGGHLNAPAPLLDGNVRPALWQARFEQFTAHVADLDLAQLQADGLDSTFLRLPPVGMLPAGSVDVRGSVGEPDFPLPAPPILPDAFVVEAVPVELESLDDYLEAGASLEPFDTSAAEQIQVLVPVPQQHFDPDLLIVEDETPDEFRDAVERFLLVLNHRLGRRFFVRAGWRLVWRLLYGREPVIPAEPQSVAGEAEGFFPVDPVLEAQELPVPDPEIHTGAGLGQRVRAVVGAMYNAVGGPNTEVHPTGGNPLASLMNTALVRLGGTAPAGLDDDQDEPDELADHMLEFRFGGRGMVGFANFTLRQLMLARERLTLSFERLHAELHRIREYVSGTQAANQLAVSPIVSAIAVRDPRAKPPPQLREFATALREAADVDVLAPDPAEEPLRATVPTASIPTGGKPIASSILFNKNLLKRLDASPPAFDASANADRATREALRTVLHIHGDLGLSLDGIEFPERLFNRVLAGLGPGKFTIETVEGQVREWLDNGNWPHEFDDEEGESDEAGFFGNAVRHLEEMVGVLRIAEARLTAFESAVELLRDEIGELQKAEAAMRGRLAELQDEVDELRHDVRVARVLEREEEERAVRENARRETLIAEHVPFLVFRRPRTVEALRVPPSVQLAATADPDVVPDCLEETHVAPEQLSAMLELIRELPINRLKIGPSIVAKIDQHAPLLVLADFVRHVTRNPMPQTYDPFAGSHFGDRVGLALRSRYAAVRGAAERMRALRGQRVSALSYRKYGWGRLRALMEDNATVADVLAAPHGKLRDVRTLSQELENIGAVAACIHERFRGIPPFVRLAWVQLVSEEDENPVRIDDLSALPAWESLDRLDRRDLQALIDWLYARFDARHDDGVGYPAELVRVALLLAGHAPVQQVIDAAVLAPAPVGTGGLVRLQLDPLRARIGMHVELFADAARRTAVGVGVVDDLSEGVAAVKMISTVGGGVVTPTHALVGNPSRGARVALAGGRHAEIGMAGTRS